MIRRMTMLACVLAGVVSTAVAPLDRTQAGTSGGPAAAAAAAAARPQDTVGTWASTEISLIQYRNITTGTDAPSSGTRVELKLFRGGHYTYSALLQVTSYSCTDTLFAQETGRAVVTRDRLTLAPRMSRFTSRDTCVARFNYEKKGPLTKRTYRWIVDRLQRGTKLCLQNEAGRTESGCYWRTGGPETAPTVDPATGASWALRHSGLNDSLWGVSCRPGARTCLAGGEEGAILTSADGGATWTNATRPAFDESIKAITCPRSGVCMAVTPDSILQVGDDGKIKAQGVDVWLLGIDCPGGACVAVGNGGSIVTGTDGGTTWTPRKSGTSSQLNHVSCPTARLCVAVGGSWDEGGVILTSADGGASWTRRLANNDYELDGVSCPTTHLCVAVGHVSADGIILTSADGGATWRAHAPGIDNILQGNPLHAVACVDARACVAVGERGTILSSTDGGATWTGQIARGSDATTLLRSVNCTSRSACVAVGDDDRSVILQLRVR